MRIFYIDDQQQDLSIVVSALAEIEPLVGTELSCEFIGPALPGERQLHFDDSAQPTFTTSMDGGVAAASISAAASTKESIFLIDVRFPNDDDYGLQLARYLVDQLGIAAERIVLFTMFPEEVQRAEAAAGANVAWFTYYHKAKFRLPVAPERLAFELIGAILHVLSPVDIGVMDSNGLVGQSDKWQKCLKLVKRAAPTGSTVLLCGESGTGKEGLAQAIHRASPRVKKPFVVVNCATLSETLLESELFGHERGAFTGAVRRKTGKVEMADTGTLFLDEVGEIPLPLQAKLLRFLQEREFERLGGTSTIRVDVRVVAATHRDLEVMIRNGNFREDLFYRLNVIVIKIPPLRERKEDIPALVAHFLAAERAAGERSLTVSPEALKAMNEYNWPGNVRELENAIKRGCILAEGLLIGTKDLQIGANSIVEGDRHRSGSINHDAQSLGATSLRVPDRSSIEKKGKGFPGVADQMHVTWESLYGVLPGIAKSGVGRHRTDRVYFKKVLRTAAMGNQDSCSWIRGVLHVLATHGPVLVASLNGAEDRFLGFLLGVINKYIGGGAAFLHDTCRITKGDIDACIGRAEKGNSHEIGNAWESLEAAKDECQKLLSSLITEEVSRIANENA